METVLRKVLCSERLPSKSGNYVCKRGEFLVQIFFAIEDAEFHNYWNSRVEYWYEEVDLKQAFEESPLWMKAFEQGRDDVLNDSELHKQMCEGSAKERYEKAYLERNNRMFNIVSDPNKAPHFVISEEDCLDIIKVAAGLEEI